MAAVVVIGEEAKVAGFALAGAVVMAAGDAESVRRAWADLPDGTGLVLVTPMAAAALTTGGGPRPGVLRVVMA